MLRRFWNLWTGKPEIFVDLKVGKVCEKVLDFATTELSEASAPDFFFDFVAQYPQIIKRPMDLGTIQTKLGRNLYR